jgi:hypothetical protein
MAAFTLSTGDYPRPYRHNRIDYFREAASQTYKRGDILILQTTADKGDQVKISGADPTSGTVVGIAAEDASGTENTQVGVYVLDPLAEFQIVALNALDFDDVGDEFGIASDATVLWKLDQTETTAKVFRVVKLAPGYTHGDTNAKYIVKSAVGVQAVYAA